jgi:hypothetical protein
VVADIDIFPLLQFQEQWNRTMICFRLL